jgi:hypothetical protein
MLHTKPRVLRKQALVPKENLVAPPSRFTHRLKARTPFRYKTTGTGKPDGHLSAGTRVCVEDEPRGARCCVVDEHGVRVAVPVSSLEKLP